MTSVDPDLPPLDPYRFFELIDTLEMDSASIKEIVFRRYVNTVADIFPLFSGFLAGGDVASFRAKAHQLKGSSLNAGAKALAAVYIELEEMAKRGDLSRAPALLTKAEAEFERLKAYLDSEEFPPKPVEIP